MNYIYLNKNIIINLLIFTFTIIILFQIYRVNTTIREGAKIRIKKPKIKNISKGITDVGKKGLDFAEDTGEAAIKAAEEAAAEAARLAEQFKIQELFMQFIKGIDKLFDSTKNTLNFIKNF
jgi:hypothetical protein